MDLIRTVYLLSALLGMLVCSGTQAAIISRTIIIDGDITDWSGIVNNPRQFSTDAEGTVDPADLDYSVQATGRDLKHFAYTYDDNNLYFYVERYASTSNKNDWWFYLDTDNDGAMQSGEPVLRVSWQGSNGSTVSSLWEYVADNTGGDPLIGPISGIADGYDMPGEIDNSVALASVSGGSSAGIEMETALPWLAVGLTGPTSVGFHISSSNGANLPNQLDDNMEGPNGGVALVFGDVGLIKTVSPASTGVGRTANFLLQVNNLSTQDAASNIVVEDVLVSQGFSYVSDDSSTTGTSYDAVTGLWQIPSLSAGQSVVLTLVARQLVAVEETRNNLAVLTEPGLIDTEPGNDGDTAAITFVDGLAIAKSVETVSDPVTGTATPKMIPGAYVDYIIDVENPSSGTPIDISVDDVLPGEVALWVVALPGLSEPFEFIDGGVSGAPSGISFSFDTLASITDSVEFSNNGGTSYTYTPIADANGLDASVTNIRFILSGTFLASAALPNPALRLRFRARIN